MKFKTTRKAVVAGSANLVSVGYCGLQHLLRNHEPVAYTCGVYGWNFDVYEVYGLTVCTGYRGMPGRSAVSCAEYEKQASDNYRDPVAVELALIDWAEANGAHILRCDHARNAIKENAEHGIMYF